MTTPNIPPSPDELLRHLIATRIAGPIATPREVNLRHYAELVRGNLRFWLGLDLGDRWKTEEDVLAVMAERAGVDPNPAHRTGQDTIDPDLTLAALDRMAAVLRDAAARRLHVLVATGHPGGLLDVHRAIAESLSTAGATVVDIPRDLRTTEGDDETWGDVRQFGGVAVLERGATLWHTHAPQPMSAILDALAESGRPRPDLVVADHGWAGRAGQHGIPTVAFADSNDPALFLGEAEGTVTVTVPLDDHIVDARDYAPMTAYLLAAAGLSAESR
ncbi:phosphatase [Embleya hyalina]|uniref:Putative phosphatase n=1 Tax=Embleya hyalina TaxID=516124 RepID=A0A401YZV9_9ACTN|nr:phosphatase [Embleya hyalina]GCE00134.1 putative phosphatase [Embleya hyalina]